METVYQNCTTGRSNLFESHRQRRWLTVVSYVSVMAGSESDLLDIEIVQREIADLRESLAQYRGVVERLLSDDEITTFSDKARAETLFQDPLKPIP